MSQQLLRDMFSQALRVKYKPACNICLVAVFDLLAANFCNPTKASLSGVLPSLASFKSGHISYHL